MKFLGDKLDFNTIVHYVNGLIGGLCMITPGLFVIGAVFTIACVARQIQESWRIRDFGFHEIRQHLTSVGIVGILALVWHHFGDVIIRLIGG